MCTQLLSKGFKDTSLAPAGRGTGLRVVKALLLFLPSALHGFLWARGNGRARGELGLSATGVCASRPRAQPEVIAAVVLVTEFAEVGRALVAPVSRAWPARQQRTMSAKAVGANASYGGRSAAVCASVAVEGLQGYKLGACGSRDGTESG